MDAMQSLFKNLSLLMMTLPQLKTPLSVAATELKVKASYFSEAK